MVSRSRRNATGTVCDQKLARDATYKRLIQRFRSEHADIFPADLPTRPAAEFLDQWAIIFQCTVCGSAYHFKDAGAHGAECPRSSPSSWSIESSTPAKHSIVALVLSLLELLGLPQDITLSSATETIGGARFVSLRRPQVRRSLRFSRACRCA